MLVAIFAVFLLLPQNPVLADGVQQSLESQFLAASGLLSQSPRPATPSN